MDLAIRIGAVTDQGLIARRIDQMRRVTVARPDYFARAGRPDHPTDLTAHDCIIYIGLASVDTWHFRAPDGSAIAVKVAGRIRVNASERMSAALMEGLGLVVAPPGFSPTRSKPARSNAS